MMLNAERLAGCRRVYLRNHEVAMSIGAHAHEKQGDQRVLINVDLWVPLALSTPRQDQLREVLDYDFIAQQIRARVSQGHIHLLETLADDVLARLLAHPKVRAARVSTEKPDVYPDCDAVGVEVWGVNGDSA